MTDALYPVPPEWAEKALIDAQGYDQRYRESVEDPENFWRREAQRHDLVVGAKAVELRERRADVLLTERLADRDLRQRHERRGRVGPPLDLELDGDDRAAQQRREVLAGPRVGGQEQHGEKQAGQRPRQTHQKT